MILEDGTSTITTYKCPRSGQLIGGDNRNVVRVVLDNRKECHSEVCVWTCQGMLLMSQNEAWSLRDILGRILAESAQKEPADAQEE